MINFLIYLFLGVGFVWKVYQQVQWIYCRPDFTGKVIFISGGSSGIGEALAKRLVFLGVKKVIIAARRQDQLARVKNECQKNNLVQTFIIDLNEPEACLKRCEELFKTEKVDIVINNGGCSQRDAFEDFDFSVC